MTPIRALTMLACVALGAAVAWHWQRPLAPEANPEPAPEVSFVTLDGERLALAGMRGRPVLVTFWATDCAPCLAEMPHLAELYRRLRDRGFALVGVAMSYDQPAQVLKLVADRQPPYPIALDPLGKVARAFGSVRVTPTSFLISPAGDIVAQHVGPLDVSGLEARIETMLRSG